MRMRIAPKLPLIDLRVRLELQPGVSDVRLSETIRSVTVHHDGRRRTRNAVIKLVEELLRRPAAEQDKSAEHRTQLRRRPSVPTLANAVIPLAPQSTRPVLALGMLAARTISRRKKEGVKAGTILDTISLGTIALTGHPVTASTSILLASVAEEWRDGLLAEVDWLLAHIGP